MSSSKNKNRMKLSDCEADVCTVQPRASSMHKFKTHCFFEALCLDPIRGAAVLLLAPPTLPPPPPPGWILTAFDTLG
ncbi:hypothetical protein F2P81_014407 [Scophthalmus maximus]|uniref:Uncharacterized protein n=1 Tax=Scophthalmus maximus TaxID=52904 RepID=A0A6A4STH8_SCOMX|nr:hypothetical protein F2P81_014407 [Scophthalmus maximus]